MSKWFNTKDKLPKHEERILVCNSNGRRYVCIFLEKNKFNLAAKKNGFPTVENHAFCSQEVPGNCLVNVLHWRKLPLPPKE